VLRAPAVAIGLLGLLLACTAVPDPPARGRATVWGYVRLVPREGVEPSAQPATGVYADPRLRGVRFVDYSQPGFAVVYREGAPSPAGVARLAIRESPFGVRLEPRYAVVGAGGTLVLANPTSRPHVVSAPALDWLVAVAPGAELELAIPSPGPKTLFLLDAPEVEATLFVAPGPYSVVSEAGRFELVDQEPGRVALRAWRARFPSASREIELPVDSILRVDIEIGVGAPGTGEHAGH
jgi:hypothetical protein